MSSAAALPLSPLTLAEVLERASFSDEVVASYVRRGWVQDPAWADAIADTLAENVLLEEARRAHLPARTEK